MKKIINLGITLITLATCLNAEANNGRVKMEQYIKIQNAEYNKVSQLDLSMRKFKQDVKQVLNLTDNDIERMADKHKAIYLKRKKLYLIPSNQKINGEWATLFHITQRKVDIHNISRTDALDIHQSQGSASYSFTADKKLLSKILQELEAGNFVINK
jgi:hypothetical protein